MGLVSELRRRNVFRMAVLYAVAAWLIMQVVEVMMSVVGLPAWAGRVTFGVLAIGFPIALIFSWFYEITPAGISLEKDIDPQESITHVTGRRLEFIVISLLCAGLILFAYDKWWIGPPPEKSIAVLPFENMSDDPNQEYFSDGISEELLNVLAQLPGLRVAARTSSFQFKGQNEDVAKIAAALNVAHILDGSIRKSGNKLRITAQLINADDGFHLWSGSYDREVDDIFAVQDEIAAAISDALKVKLALVAGDVVQPTVSKAANTDAYEAYLRGRELIRLRGRQNMDQAIRELERALLLDNNFAPAHANLAIAIGLSGIPLGTPEWEEARRKAIRHLDRALELEPDLAEAHGGRALLATDPESKIEHARKALVSNPSYVDAMNWMWLAQLNLGRYTESDVTIKQMLVIDPLNNVGRINNGYRLGRLGQVEEAHQTADQLLAQNRRMAYALHGMTYFIHEGKIAESLFWNLRAMAERRGFSSPHAALGFAWVGEYDEARRVPNSRDYVMDIAEGRFDEAITKTQRKIRLAPDSTEAIEPGAFALYAVGRIDKALPLYERLLDIVPEGRPINYRSGRASISDLEMTMQLALARRKGGDEEAAQAAAQIVRQEHAARLAAGRKHQWQHRAEAMLAAFDNDPDGVIVALQSAMQLGLRNPQFFDDPIFADLREEPRFIALQQELDAILAVEHQKVLQLICFNNPVPDDWQPMPETCEGVVEQSRL